MEDNGFREKEMLRTEAGRLSNNEVWEPDKNEDVPSRVKAIAGDDEKQANKAGNTEPSQPFFPAKLLTLQPFKALASSVWNSGVMCMAISSFIQSASALFVKTTDGRVPIFEIVAVRSSICLLATFVMIRMQELPEGLLGGTQFLAAKFVRGFAGAISMSVYYYAIFKLSLSDTVTIFFTNPAMVVVLAWVVRGEAVQWHGIMGILLSMGGVVLVAKPPFIFGGEHWTHDHVEGVVACLMAAFTAAIAFTSVRFIPKTVPSVCVAAWFHLMGLLTAGIPLALGLPSWPILPSLADSACVVGIGICSFTSHLLIARSLQIEAAAKATAAGFLQVVFAYVFGLALLGEAVKLLSVAGSLVICVGVIATSWPGKKAVPQELPIVGKPVEGSYELVPLTEESEDKEGPVAVIEVENEGFSEHLASLHPVRSVSS